MIFGSVPTERIQFNEDSLWTGDENDTGYYQDFGDVFIDLPGQTAGSDFRRHLDLDNAVATVHYTANGIHYQREYFSSAPGQVVAMHLTADKPGAYTGTVRLTDAHGAVTVAADNRLTISGRLANGLKYLGQLVVLHQGGSVTADHTQIHFAGRGRAHDPPGSPDELSRISRKRGGAGKTRARGWQPTWNAPSAWVTIHCERPISPITKPSLTG